MVEFTEDQGGKRPFERVQQVGLHTHTNTHSSLLQAEQLYSHPVSSSALPHTACYGHTGNFLIFFYCNTHCFFVCGLLLNIFTSCDCRLNVVVCTVTLYAEIVGVYCMCWKCWKETFSLQTLWSRSSYPPPPFAGICVSAANKAEAHLFFHFITNQDLERKKIKGKQSKHIWKSFSVLTESEQTTCRH